MECSNGNRTSFRNFGVGKLDMELVKLYRNLLQCNRFCSTKHFASINYLERLPINLGYKLSLACTNLSTDGTDQVPCDLYGFL